MQLRFIYIFLGVFTAIWVMSMSPGMAQQTDTTQTTKQLKKRKSFPQPYHSERSTDTFLLPSSGTYGVPEPTEYYTPPFQGQKYLDLAVEAYREELRNSVANTPLFQFLKKIAPFVGNRFEFSFYNMYDVPIVDRDNPLLYPQLDNGKQKQE